ncbi:hypothetical protein K493DRAFT_314235 [Basidiobolus meristosporus CBS 931.73]|uniref:Uncharacterized protein n=1 Tax=Basidiobolus meristosporus CBS 931.73 TaxID=1314790 RepID=A0A1Y1YH85_9FUNG|nr:hypothetical protein K493DRAFT_314235 [Basidiobolus meristosporus CBS 931.73]|eukprot:ORX97086.1 hypothetical protein K493DRAFT_314235 [Basidiobolus meristosporus CBS 931.73]
MTGLKSMKFPHLVSYLSNCTTDRLEEASRLLEGGPSKQGLPVLEFGQDKVGTFRSTVVAVHVNPKTHWLTFHLKREEYLFHHAKPRNLCHLWRSVCRLRPTPPYQHHPLNLTTTGMNIQVVKDCWHLTYLVEKVPVDHPTSHSEVRAVIPLSFQCHLGFLRSELQKPRAPSRFPSSWWRPADTLPYFRMSFETDSAAP